MNAVCFPMVYRFRYNPGGVVLMVYKGNHCVWFKGSIVLSLAEAPLKQSCCSWKELNLLDPSYSGRIILVILKHIYIQKMLSCQMYFGISSSSLILTSV